MDEGKISDKSPVTLFDLIGENMKDLSEVSTAHKGQKLVILYARSKLYVKLKKLNPFDQHDNSKCYERCLSTLKKIMEKGHKRYSNKLCMLKIKGNTHIWLNICFDFTN